VPDFRSQGVRIHYELAGPPEGSPILVVHGFASDYRLNWVGSRWQEALTQAGRLVIGPDLRGHGASEKPHHVAAYDRRIMAADLLGLLDDLGIEQADYLGYSMGGYLGMLIAAQEPERLRRAVLGGVGLPRESARMAAIARRLKGDEGETDPIAQFFYNFAAGRPENDLEALAACIVGPNQGMDPDRLRQVPVPILIADGDQDPVARDGEALADLLPQGEFVYLPGRNHMSAVVAREFKQAALEFLKPGERFRSGGSGPGAST
jgi:pimeloyl-ACP methyl ester carboxylesterase